MPVPASRLGIAAVLAGVGGLLAVFAARPTSAQPVPVSPPGQPTMVARNGFENLSFPDTGEARDAGQKFEAVQAYMRDRSPDKVPWDLVCDTAQFLLDAGSDYFYEPKGPPDADGRNRYVSIKTETNRIIGGFPKEGRQFYQVTFGPAAAALLQDAVAAGYDRAQLAACAQRYFHTKAGGEAALLLATLDLESGRFSEAAYGFDRLLNRPASDDLLTPLTLLKAAMAFKRAGDPRLDAAAQRVWGRLEANYPRDGLTVGRRTFSLDDLRAEFARPAELMFGSLGDDFVFMRYGNPSRTGVQSGGTPFLDPAFNTYPMLWRQEDPGDNPAKPNTHALMHAAAYAWVREAIEGAYQQLNQAKGQVALPGFFPVTAPDLILFRTYDAVCAVVTRDGLVDPNGKVHKAGELFWASRPTPQSGLAKLRAGPYHQNLLQWWTQWQQQHRMPTLAFDNPQVGSLSHDGKNVYFVDDLAIPPPPQVYNPNFGGFPPGVVAHTGDSGSRLPTDFSKVVALNLSDGKLMWELGGPIDSSPPDPNIPLDQRSDVATEQSIFLGPPLPVGGKLYLMFERDQQLHVACVDPQRVLSPGAPGRDGKGVEVKAVQGPFPALEWVQKLGSPNVRLSQDSLRRIQPAFLAYADGVLVCPTNCGAVVAVDVNARSLLWARGYAAVPPAGTGMEDFPAGGRRLGRRPVTEPAARPLSSDRWRAAAPIISGGKVVVAAHDADQLLCLDLRSGDLIWADDRKPDDLYVGGVIGDKVLVVGKESVRAYELAGAGNGKPKLAWGGLKTGTPCGHGAATRDGLYFLPMLGDADRSESKDPQVWAIDVAAGVARSKTAFRRDDLGVDPQFGPDDLRKRLALGNIVFHDGMMFSQSASQVSAFPLIELKKREMDRLLAADPNDPTGLTNRGELRLDSGDLRGAIADFKEADRHNPPQSVRRKLRQKLYQAYTELLRNDFAAAESILAEYESLCEVPTDAEDPSERQRQLSERVRRRALFLTLVARGREKQGRLAEAFRYYREFASLGESKELVHIFDEPNGMTRPDVWARGRIDAMVRSAKDPAARRPLEDLVRKEWDAVRAADDLDALRGFVKVFGPNFPAGRDAQLLLAERLIRTGTEDDAREAQVQLMQLWATADDPATEARAVEALARVMTRRGMPEDAVGLYARLGTKYADVIVRDGKTGADFFNDLITDKRLLPYLEPSRSAAPGNYRIETLGGQMSRPILHQQFAVDPDGADFPFFRRYRLTMEQNPNTSTWMLRLVDRITGGERNSFQDLSAVHPTGGQGAANYRLAQARGHMVLVNVGLNAVCLDLSATTSDGKLGQELWRYPLFRKNPQPTGGQSPIPQIDPKNPNELVINFEDGWTLRLGRSAVLQPNYVCLLTRDGLTALDPVTGHDLWQRSNVSLKSQVFGDARYVFLVETNPTGEARSRVFRALDGTAVEGVKDFAQLVVDPNRLAILDRNILLVEGSPLKGRSLRLYDPLTGQDVWRKPIPTKAQVLKVIDPELTGYFTAEGEFEVLESRTGQSRFRGRIDPDRIEAHAKEPAGGLVQPLLLADDDRFYLFLNRSGETRFSGSSGVIRSVPVNGAAYGFDKTTGKRLWFTDPDGLFRGQNLFVERFDELPALIAAGQVFDEASRVPSFRVAVLDKQTGKVRFPYGKPVGQGGGQFSSMYTDPKNPRVVELWRYDLRLRVVPDDDPKELSASAGWPSP